MSDAILRAALLRAAVDERGPEVPSHGSWARWVSIATRERVLPLLFELVQQDGSALSSADIDHAQALQIDTAALSVRLEQSLLQVAELLDARAITYAVLKGVATANLDYERPGQRQFGDVDLLIDPVDLSRTRQVLESNGWRQAFPLPRHHEAFTHAVTFGGVGIAEIDVHQRVGHRALGLRIPTAQLLRSRVELEIASQRLWALGAADRLIHAAVHAVASRGQYRRLSSVADVLVLSRTLADCDVTETLDRAEQWRVRPLVEAAVRRAHGGAMLELPDRWHLAMTVQTGRRDRLLERAYLGDRRRPLVEEAAHLRAMDRWRDRGLYLYGHLHMDAGPGAGGLGTRLRYLRSRARDRT